MGQTKLIKIVVYFLFYFFRKSNRTESNRIEF